ncbi:MAG: DUF975 family protein [Clostridia bacterium]|nr:DUF975 family protein [Clostridia bacterium]
MWKRKELKIKAKQVVKKNYWTAVVVCFLIALLTGEFGTSIIGIWQAEDSMDPNYVIHNKNIIIQDQIKEEKIQEVKEKKPNTDKIKLNLNTTELKMWDMIAANLNNITKSHKYIFKIWDAVESFNMNQITLGIEFLLIALIAIIFTVVIADPLIVAGKRYFLKAREKNSTKMGIMGEIFKKGNWINVGIIMFFKNIYTLLWYLTIIGGMIKTYEYRMIPYILAENPKTKKKEAFYLSKKMMKGNKWKTFILDLSFVGWNFISIFTFGLLNILYINPYKVATTVELYIILKNNEIRE